MSEQESDMKISAPCKILDKRTKDGWFGGRSYYITIKILTDAEDSRSKIKHVNPSVIEWGGTTENYYNLNVGEVYMVAMYRHSDDCYYPQTEQ